MLAKKGPYGVGRAARASGARLSSVHVLLDPVAWVALVSQEGTLVPT